MQLLIIFITSIVNCAKKAINFDLFSALFVCANSSWSCSKTCFITT